MTTSSLGLRQIAYAYCQFVSKFFILGLDGYQIVLNLVLLASLCGIGFWASGRGRAIVNRFCPPWLYCILLVCTLFIARLPTFLPGSLNPDESMLLVGAMKLRRYPVFWQSFDGTTSGPLNFYALTLLNLLGLPLDFAAARLLNILCIGGAIAIVYLIARLFMPDWTARLTALPALAVAMAFRWRDFIHYSSECVSVLMIAIATWLLLAETLADRVSWLRGIGIGFIAALLPLAKLQAAPIAVTIAAGGLAHSFFRRQEPKWRGIFYVSAGLAAGIASLLLFLTAFGLFETFQRSYIMLNILQANLYPPESFIRFLRYCLSPDLKWYEGGILACVIYLLARFHHFGTRAEEGSQVSNRSVGGLYFCDLFVLLLLASSLYVVYRPRTRYPHYLLLLIFPIALVGVRTLAWSLRLTHINKYAGSNLTARQPAVVFVLFTLALPSLARSVELTPWFESEAWMVAFPAAPQCRACPLIERFTNAGDLITIWGWAPQLYVMTGTLPATRDPETPYQIVLGGPQIGYYRRRYLDDLQLHPPRIFVDAVGPRQFAYHDRDAYGFETFPELRQYVTNNFYLAGDVDGVRVFARRESPASGIPRAPINAPSNLK
jgi:hypothetical protein